MKEALTQTIRDVHFHNEERSMQGSMYGSYSSNYIAKSVEYPNGIVVVESLAASMHPDWTKKTR